MLHLPPQVRPKKSQSVLVLLKSFYHMKSSFKYKAQSISNSKWYKIVSYLHQSLKFTYLQSFSLILCKMFLLH